MSDKTLRQLAQETYDRLWNKHPTETEMDVIRSAVAILYAALKAEQHCATCQCNKLHETKPVPGNPLSKSWHDNSSTAPHVPPPKDKAHADFVASVGALLANRRHSDRV